MDKRITQKGKLIPRSRREPERPSEEKEMYLRRLSIGEPILSKTENGFFVF